MTLTIILLGGCALSPSAAAATLQVGPGKPYAEPSAAIAAAHDGDTVLIAPGTYYDCAFVRQNNITIAGSAPGATAVLTDKTCGGKAILVVDGHDVTIRNLTLARARVMDQNGAGIRAEGVNLTVDGVKFVQDQDGILSAPEPNSTIIVRNSTFDRDGFCGRDCAHALYIGRIKLLRVIDSTFFDTQIGHHIKSRANRTEVIGCHISDGPNGTASYEIDIPNGGALVVRNNVIVKGPKAQNRTAMIIIGEEGVDQPTPEISIDDNTVKNEGDYDTYFVFNVTATKAILKGNKFSGRVKPLRGDGVVE